MRRWFGSDVPNLLGENMTSGTVLRFWSAICKGIDRFEPRFKVVKITAIGTPPTMRKGDLGFDVQGIYYPRGHLGDFSVSIPKTFVAGVDVAGKIISIPSLRIPTLPRLRASLVKSGQQFFASTLVILSTLLVEPSFAENQNTFFAPTVNNIENAFLAPSLFSDADSFYSATALSVTQLSAPAPFGADDFYAPIVSASATLSPSLFTEADTAYAPTVSPLGNTLAPIRLDDADSFYIASVDPIVSNLLSKSETFVEWTATGSTVAQNVDNDYALEPHAVSLTEFASTSSHGVGSPSLNVTSGTTYTASVYAKYTNAQYMQILFGGAAFGVNAFANFDIQNGTLGTVGSAATAKIEANGNGWYRISVTAPAIATTSTTIAINGASSSTLGRAVSYAGDTSKTRLIAKAQIATGTLAGKYVSTESAVTLTGNTANTIVGAIRWDAWFHPTADTIRTAVETSLGPAKYHWRLPFFATEPTSNSATIAGTQADMDAEIAYAKESGLDYWAFFWYGLASTNGMRQAWDYYQASPNKNDVNWCLYFSGITPLNNEVANNLAGLVSYMQQSNYQKTASGRPLIFVFDDAASKTTIAGDLATLRAAAISAGLADPYIAFHQSTPTASVINDNGFDATTSYAPATGPSGAKPFVDLDTAARAKWAAQLAQSVDVIPTFSLGWDRRPRVDNPVPWEGAVGSISDYYYEVRRTDISTHVDACLAFVRDNPTAAPENVIIGYAWNENDEGGWISPTKASAGVNKGHVLSLKAVLIDANPSLSPSLFTDGDTFYSPSVSASNTLSPSLLSDGDTFYSATAAASGGPATIYSASPALATNDPNNANTTFRVLVPITSAAQTDLWVTIKPGTDGSQLTILGMGIGKWSGTLSATVAPIVELPFSGASGFANATTEKVSDHVDVSALGLQAGDSAVVTFTTGGSGQASLSYNSAQPAGVVTYWQTGTHWNLQNPTGSGVSFNSLPNYNFGIVKIETSGGGGGGSGPQTLTPSLFTSSNAFYTPVVSGGSESSSEIPLTFDDARFATNTEETTYRTYNNPLSISQTFTNKDWDSRPNMWVPLASRDPENDPLGNQFLQCDFGSGMQVVCNQCRAFWREGFRVNGSGPNAKLTVNECYIQMVGVIYSSGVSPEDHADGVQAFCENVTVEVTNSMFRTCDDARAAELIEPPPNADIDGYGTDAFRWADLSSGTIIFNNVIIYGDGRGVNIWADTGTTTIDFENVYFVDEDPTVSKPDAGSGQPGARQHARLAIGENGGTIVISNWTNVRLATIVGGEIIPGDIIPEPVV
jgi:hypothetical protein